MDLLERVVRDLDETEREVVELWLLGYTHAEISDQTERSQSTVARVLKIVRQRLQRVWFSEA